MQMPFDESLVCGVRTSRKVKKKKVMGSVVYIVFSLFYGTKQVSAPQNHE